MTLGRSISSRGASSTRVLGVTVPERELKGVEDPTVEGVHVPDRSLDELNGNILLSAAAFLAAAMLGRVYRREGTEQSSAKF